MAKAHKGYLGGSTALNSEGDRTSKRVSAESTVLEKLEPSVTQENRDYQGVGVRRK